MSESRVPPHPSSSLPAHPSTPISLPPKRSVSFVDSMGMGRIGASPTEVKLAEARRRMLAEDKHEEERQRAVLKDESCLPYEHACISSDWKMRYGGRVVVDQEDAEDICIPQHVVLPSEAAPKRKREARHLESNEAQNSLVCKVHLVDSSHSSSVHRWRRLVVPSSTFCQTLVDIVVNSFEIPAASFYARKHGAVADRLLFKGGPHTTNTATTTALTKKQAAVKHAILVPFSDLNLEPGDGFDIFHGSIKLSVHVEYVRDAHSLKYNIEGATGLATYVNNVQIIGANAGEIFL